MKKKYFTYLLTITIIFSFIFQLNANANTLILWDDFFSSYSPFTINYSLNTDPYSLLSKIEQEETNDEDTEKEKQEKSPAIGALLSFFVPGLGHIYAQEYEKGAIVMASAVAILSAYQLVDYYRPKTETVDGRLETLTLTLQLGGIGFWLWNFTDAFKTIEKQNKPDETIKNVNP